jgi:hypothetical protein
MQRCWPVLGVVAALVLLSTAVVARAEAPGNGPFRRTWARTDRPVAELRASRTWMWGPQANSVLLYEDYAESPDGRRVVQYYDKSRMEITDPDGDQSVPWYVTNGLLVVELVSGRLQLGDNAFVDHQPAAVNVAGDADDPTGPTYATFGPLRAEPPLPDGAIITQRLARDGTVTADPELAGHGVTATQRVTVPGIDHQVASPFWTFMNSSGTIYAGGGYSEAALFPNPYYATGLPISEAYWANVKVGGSYRDVLMQCFERRCLTYTPGNPDGFLVEAGNVGQHYYAWRYADTTPVPAPAPAPEVPASGAWRQLQPGGAVPQARRDHTLAADATGERVYLFGGRSGGSPLSDFWVYDVAANTWAQLPGGPSARFGHNAAFDAGHGRVVIFGGQGTDGFLSDVWAYTVATNSWSPLVGNGAEPLDRYGAGGAYDPLSGSLYISHGFTSDGRFDDTWSYSLHAGSWSDLSPASGARPEPRCLLRTAADPARNRLLLFGGQSNTAAFLGDLWAFDLGNSTWTQLATNAPPARNLYSLAVSHAGEFMLLFGGATAAGNDGALYAFDFETGAWSTVAYGAGPSPRSSHDAVWLARRSTMLLFGGSAGGDLNDLWEFVPD